MLLEGRIRYAPNSSRETVILIVFFILLKRYSLQRDIFPDVCEFGTGFMYDSSIYVPKAGQR